MTKKFKRKRLLLSEKNKKFKSVGYARASNDEFEYLEEQIESLKKEGCSLVFAEFLPLEAEKIQPQLNKAIDSLSKGDELILTKLDRAFLNKKDCLKTINKLINKDIKLRTLSGFSATNYSQTNSSIFKILFELDNLEENSLSERKKELVLNRKLSGLNLGGRPKISPLKEKLVIRLRNEGNSYRSIRTQTGIALSTIRRIIIDEEAK